MCITFAIHACNPQKVIFWVQKVIDYSFLGVEESMNGFAGFGKADFMNCCTFWERCVEAAWQAGIEHYEHALITFAANQSAEGLFQF